MNPLNNLNHMIIHGQFLKYDTCGKKVYECMDSYLTPVNPLSVCPSVRPSVRPSCTRFTVKAQRAHPLQSNAKGDKYNF